MKIKNKEIDLPEDFEWYTEKEKEEFMRKSGK